MKNYDIVIIGGGPAGLAAAIRTRKDGASVCLIEREARLGGVLKQCIHDGFGLVHFKEKLSGPEYADRFLREAASLDIESRCECFVTHIDREADGTFRLHAVSRNGMETLAAKALILATGCRERTARQAGIHGTHPAGILTAGTAQYYMNLLGQSIGHRCVILGSGDIGLIMARRMTLEGMEVEGVYEILPTPSGLARNVRQCLEDFSVPLHLSSTVTRVFGTERVEAVEVAAVDAQMAPVAGTERRIPCDTLVVSAGLIPENELAQSLGVEMDPATRGPVADRHQQTSVPGVFACGNCFHVFDLVDYVTQSGETAGAAAAAYCRGALETTERMQVVIPPKKKVTPGKLVCIGCPKGCEMDVTARPDGTVECTGNSCPKGLAFAIAEQTAPMRMLCSTVPTAFADQPVFPVRTSTEIPKALLADAMREINRFTLDRPVNAGDVLISDILGTGADIIATSSRKA